MLGVVTEKLNLELNSNQNPKKVKKILILPPRLDSSYLQIIYFFILSVYGIKKMRGNGRHEILVITSNQWIKRKLQEVSVSCKSFREYSKDIPLGEINSWAISRVNILSMLMDRDSVNNAMSFRGVSFRDGIPTKYIFDPLFREAAKTVATAENIIDIEAPDEIFLLDCRHFREKIVFAVAKSRGVKVSVIPPLMVSGLIYLFIDFMKLLKNRGNSYKRMFFGLWESFFEFERETNRNDIDNRSIILLQNYHVTAPQFISVINELRKDRKNEIIVLCIKKKDQEILIRENVDFKEFNYFIDQKRSQKINRAWKSVNKAWRHLIHSPQLQELMKYQDRKILDVMEGELVNLYPRTYFECIETLAYLRRIGKLDLIVLGHDNRPYEKLCLCFGKLHQVPTLNIQYAGDGTSDFRKNHTVKELEITCDKKAVWGKVFRDASIKNGVEPGKLVVTGNPRFDSLIKLKASFNKENFKKDKKIPLDKKILLIATGPLTYKAHEKNWNELFEERAILWQILGKILEKNPEMQLILKPHPRDDIKFATKFVKEAIPNSIILDKEVDTYESICACDVLITKDSTVGFEAMVLEKPVICFDFIGQLERNEYVSSGAAFGVSNIEEFESAIKNAMQNQKVVKNLRSLQKKFIYERGYKLDGHSSRRVADLICDMVEKSHN